MSIPTRTRNLLFTGKGGVGKTSMACATAIHLADAGRKVLLVSTDPASNLVEVLGTELGSDPTFVPGVPGLWAMNIDPGASAQAYRERIVGPYRDLLPPAAVASIEEQLSGACTVEIASFDEFSKLLAPASFGEAFDHIVFDTAPTGHTLRLLELPAAWSDFISNNKGGTSCLGPLSGLKTQRKLYGEARAALADGTNTLVVLVARPESSALQEAERTRVELADLGILNHHLALNGVFKASVLTDPIAAAMETRGRKALEALPAGLSTLPRTEIPLKAASMMGVQSLRRMGVEGPAVGPVETPLQDAAIEPPPVSWTSLVQSLLEGRGGVLLAMGKGGVGKTAVARRLATDLALAGRTVHLTTTDPAAKASLRVPTTALPTLTMSRIDPEQETAAYTREVLAAFGSGLDPAALALLEEDLRSPCTAEIAVFRAFAKEVAKGKDGFVVIDTAPTGHTLLLLDAAEAYHREVSRTPRGMPEEVRTLLPRLRDPDFTKVFLVAIPEATPVHEAMGLAADLHRARITPFAWVLNQALSPLHLQDPVLQARAKQEGTYLQEVASAGLPWAVIPWQGDAESSLEQPSPRPQGACTF